MYGHGFIDFLIRDIFRVNYTPDFITYARTQNTIIMQINYTFWYM
jgi:hypothetical protein